MAQFFGPQFGATTGFGPGFDSFPFGFAAPGMAPPPSQANQTKGPPPVSKKMLASLLKQPKVVTAEDVIEETNRCCAVCLDIHVIGGEAVKLPCSHLYCHDCIKDWLSRHCTCPVCRFEFQTDDPAYETDRRQRLRRPRYRMEELKCSPLSQLKALAATLQVNTTGCLEKSDVVQRLLASGKIEILAPASLQFTRSELARMPVRELRELMATAGMAHVECLEKGDMVRTIMASGRVTVVDDIGGGANGGGGGGGDGGVGGSYGDVPSSSNWGGQGNFADAAGGGGGGGDSGSGGGVDSGGGDEAAGSDAASRESPTGTPAVGSDRSGGGDRNDGGGGADCVASDAETSTAALLAMGVAQLKRTALAEGVRLDGCVEKRDIVERLIARRRAAS